MNPLRSLSKKLLKVVRPEFSVRPQGRAGILYREGRREMMVDSEILFGAFDMVIYADTIARWLPPHEAEPVTSGDRDRIRQRIAHSLRRMKIEWA